MRITRGAFLALLGGGLLLVGCSSAGNKSEVVPPPTQARRPTPVSPPTLATSPALPSPSASEKVSAPLTCEDVRKPASPGFCGILAKAPRADLNTAATQRAIEVWRRMEGPFAALSGRETELVVLAAAARMSEEAGAKALPPAAFICPGAPPTVYVPDTLLKLIAKGGKRGRAGKGYPEDFLAFVLGHELAHRMNDLTEDGCQLAAFQRPGKGQHEEELADARSAFFMTNVGYSASKVANADMVTKFLEAEFELGRSESKGRRDSLLGALASFDTYEALYQAGLAVAMSGEMEAADRLLSWADELITAQGVPLPELRVVRAITRINRAKTMAPWTSELGLSVAIDSLRCTPLHPGHSGLWEEGGKTVRGPDIEQGRRLLREALQLLQEAARQGATLFTVSAARACAALYLGDASLASEAQGLAERSKAARAPASVTKALASNRALVDFLAYLKGNPAPADEESGDYQNWAAQLSKGLVTSKTPPQLLEVIRALEDPSAAPSIALASAALPSTAHACAKRAALPPATLTTLPSAKASECPKGYRLLYTLPSAKALNQGASTQGWTHCEAMQSEETFVAVSLAATSDPPTEALSRTMRISPPPAALERLAPWACHCSSLRLQGVSDTGEEVFRARCATLGLDRGSLVTSKGKVLRVIQHSR